MLTRRIVTSVCALCLAIPAAAGASSATNPPGAQGPYGVTTAAGSQDTIAAKGPYGITTNRGSQDTTKAKGPYAMITATGSRNTAKVHGPFGITTATGARDTGPTAPAAGASRRDDTNGWRAAAISEAALLAALALGSALLVPARRRAPRLGT